MKLVIVTGMSGAGKTIALKMLEDLGFYCVDNLPISLADKFVQLVSDGGTVQKAARYPQRGGSKRSGRRYRKVAQRTDGCTDPFSGCKQYRFDQTL